MRLKNIFKNYQQSKKADKYCNMERTEIYKLKLTLEQLIFFSEKLLNREIQISKIQTQPCKL